MDFQEIITDPVELRELMGEPLARAVAKSMTSLNQHCRDVISRSPFVLIASANSQGQMDVSPKGDPPGFVRVLDDSTLAIPERPGNRRADTYNNVLENPRIALIFLTPGKNETLRLSGTAQIVRDLALRESMAMRGKTPEFVLVVTVQEVFFHCAKCIIRSQLWEPSAWPSLDGLPTLAETLVAAAGLSQPVEELDKAIKKAESEELY